MNRRQQRFILLIDLAHKKTETAAQQLEQTQQALQQVQLQLQTLQQYRGDYIQRWEIQKQAGMAAHQLHHYRGFMQHLDVSITEQAENKNKIEEHYQQAQQQWHQARQYETNLQKLSAKWNVEIERAQEKREQQQLDDRYSRR